MGGFPRETDYSPVNPGTVLESSAGIWRPSLGRRFLCRALLVTVLVILTHPFEWRWLRLLTAEAILRISPALGLATERVAFDTVRVQEHFCRFAISCTFADVFMGAIPLVWDVKKSVFGNLSTLAVAAVGLFVFNVLRLELGVFLFAHGSPRILADDILGGVAYFAVWMVILSVFGRNWFKASSN